MFGASASGKPTDFDSVIRRFESCRPIHFIRHEYKGFAMGVEEKIKERIVSALDPQMVEVVDESAGHAQGGSSHFRSLVVSSAFEGLSAVQRQRKVFQALGSELMRGIHAFSQQTYTPKEWEEKGELRKSPPCRRR